MTSNDGNRAFVIGITSAGVLDTTVGDDGALALESGDYYFSFALGQVFEDEGKILVMVERKLAGGLSDPLEFVLKELEYV